jgi:hypothetical protein
MSNNSKSSYQGKLLKLAAVEASWKILTASVGKAITVEQEGI